MNLKPLALATLLALTAPVFAQGANPADVDATVAAVKSANPDMRGLCQKGPDGIRAAVTQAISSLMPQGKINGNPQAIGQEAGQRIGRECRGG